MTLFNPDAAVIIKKGREKSIQNRHPWLFSGAIERFEGTIAPGDIVTVYAHNRQFLGKGFVNPEAQIAVRLLTWRNEDIDDTFWQQRLADALTLRKRLVKDTSGFRLIHGESDGFPGLVVDQYGKVLVLQSATVGMNRLKPQLLEWLKQGCQPNLIVERSESGAMIDENLPHIRQVLWGEGDGQVEIQEHGARFLVDVLQGQKTGFFLDQRENRYRVGQWAAGQHLLNCFSYTGGFSVQAALQGAVATSVDISQPAQDMAQEQFRRNGLDAAAHRFVTGNVFQFLRDMEPIYDFIVLDPPAFAKNRTQLKQATQAYKDINRLAMRNSKPNGLILTCSCSHHLDWDLFQKVVFAAATESGRQVQMIGRWGQPPDHPISLFHPEGEYLKTFLLRVV